jgi:hypothetical protein
LLEIVAHGLVPRDGKDDLARPRLCVDAKYSPRRQCQACNPAQANPAQANPAQANPAQANPAQANPAQANPAQASTPSHGELFGADHGSIGLTSGHVMGMRD